MQDLLRKAALVLVLSGGAALAQDAGQTGALPAPPPGSPMPPPSNGVVPPPTPLAPPPPGTLATVKTEHSWDARGDQYYKQQSRYRDPSGVAQDQTTVQTRTAPPPVVQQQTTTTTTTTAPPQ